MDDEIELSAEAQLAAVLMTQHEQDVGHAFTIALTHAQAMELQQELFNAGVPGVCDPEIHQHSKRHLQADLTEFHHSIQQQAKAAAAHVCGWCGKPKEPGAWCENYNCELNKKKRGEI